MPIQAAMRQPVRDDVLAYNLWQLNKERKERERRLALQRKSFLKPLPKGWWQWPTFWTTAFSALFMSRDAFAALLVELIVKAGY